MSVEQVDMRLKHFGLGDKIVLAFAVMTLIGVLFAINRAVNWGLNFATFEYGAGMVTAAGLIWIAWVAIKWLEARLP